MPTPTLPTLVALAALSAPPAGAALPDGFVYLRATAPEIAQDLRYYGSHNFIGRPIDGYEAPECILTREAADVFRLGYVAQRSGHSRGSTVDLVLEPADTAPASAPAAPPDQPAASCTAPLAERYPDSPLDFGTGYDCMDDLSHPDSTAVPAAAQANRARLAQAMDRHGFRALTTGTRTHADAHPR